MFFGSINLKGLWMKCSYEGSKVAFGSSFPTPNDFSRREIEAVELRRGVSD